MAQAPKQEQPGVLGWIEYRLPIISMLNDSLVKYPTPRNQLFLEFWLAGGHCAG